MWQDKKVDVMGLISILKDESLKASEPPPLATWTLNRQASHAWGPK
jgi:hypothetical protein